MKVSNAFGVGTARYTSTHAPFLVEDPALAIIDVPEKIETRLTRNESGSDLQHVKLQNNSIPTPFYTKTRVIDDMVAHVNSDLLQYIHVTMA